ncbi:phospholipase D family protein [Aquipuribacter sp. SD81]|uniref:phospholipase D family protein n=1 Tax=Aquipuribacter sp. SD81 TaxID=3127703 RepID=UPI0030166DC8
MDLSFAAQPWAAGTNLDDYFAHTVAAAADAPHRLVIVSAWAKRSGFSRIGPDLEAVRASGGSVEMIIGISEGGATRQGLELALQMADRVEVFHDLGGRTFHPKVYLATGLKGARLWVGSNNLTAGGLSSNYEAALSLNCSVDEPVVRQVTEWIDRLRADGDCCKMLTRESLAVMVADGRYRIGDEDARRPAERATEEATEGEGDTDSVTDDEAMATAGLFSPSQTAKRGSRRNPRGATGGTSGTQRDTPTQPGEDDDEVAVLPAGHTIARWSKLLKRSDAQQTPAGTQPTGALRLSSSGHGIDQTTYFRHEFFDRETWADDLRKPGTELASVQMAVSVDDQALGLMAFRVDHNPNREAGQNNVTTVLKWGPMNAYLRANDHENDWVLIEKLSNGYRLSITPEDPQTK